MGDVNSKMNKAKEVWRSERGWENGVCACTCVLERETGLPSSTNRPPSPNVCDNLSLLLAWLTNYLQENEFFRHGFVLWE